MEWKGRGSRWVELKMGEEEGGERVPGSEILMAEL